MAMDIRDSRNATTPESLRTPSTPEAARTSQTVQESKTTTQFMAGGGIGETLGGIAVIVLAIVGLAGWYPMYVLGAAVIVFGGALLLQGASMASHYYSLMDESVGSQESSEMELGSGMGGQVLGGVAGIVLGILAVLGIVPVVLEAISAIVFGGCLLFSCGSNRRLSTFSTTRGYTFGRFSAGRRVAADVLTAATGVQALAALAGIILGIIALANPYFPITLTLVALLVMGAAVTLSGGAITARMVNLINRR